jgi:hypothetical protein
LPHVWIYELGHQEVAQTSIDMIADGLRAAISSSPFTSAEVWRPFISEQEHRGERHVLVLIFGSLVADCAVLRREGLALCHALALHEAGRARVIPVF